MSNLSINSKKYKAVLFDWDGTLVHSEAINHQAYVKIYEELGLKYHTLQEHLDLYGGLKADEVFNRETARLNIDWDLAEIIPKKRSLYYELHETTIIEFVNGALELLNKIKAMNLKVGIVSMSYSDLIISHLTKAAVSLKFDTIVGAGEVTKHKPDPECYLKAAAELRLKPQDCLVFEDTIPGIESATGAGMDCIAILTSHKKEFIKEKFKKIKIIKDFTEVEIV